MSRKVIGLDFDDVLVHCFKHVLLFHNSKYGTSHELKELTSYSLANLWKCEHDEEMRKVMEYHASDFAKRPEPVEGAVKAITKLAESYDLVIVTMRAPEIKDITFRLLEHFPDVFKQIHFLGTRYNGGTPRNKDEICEKIGASLFIDDGLHHAEKISATGIPVLLLDAAWNQAETLPHNVKRVFSWEEILTEVKNRLG